MNLPWENKWKMNANLISFFFDLHTKMKWQIKQRLNKHKYYGANYDVIQSISMKPCFENELQVVHNGPNDHSDMSNPSNNYLS
jgi:hypothetical protein